MPYIKYEEFQNIVGNERVQMDAFNRYLKKASAIVDNITGNFYQFNDLNKDIAFRSLRFKEALCAQIIYFSEMQGDTYEGLNRAPQSFSIGRTNVSNGSRYNAGGENESKNLVAEDVYTYLEGTGLLFRGTGGACR